MSDSVFRCHYSLNGATGARSFPTAGTAIGEIKLLEAPMQPKSYSQSQSDCLQCLVKGYVSVMLAKNAAVERHGDWIGEGEGVDAFGRY